MSRLFWRFVSETHTCTFLQSGTIRGILARHVTAVNLALPSTIKLVSGIKRSELLRFNIGISKHQFMCLHFLSLPAEVGSKVIRFILYQVFTYLEWVRYLRQTSFFGVFYVVLLHSKTNTQHYSVCFRDFAMVFKRLCIQLQKYNQISRS